MWRDNNKKPLSFSSHLFVVFRARIRTTGVTETNFVHQGVPYNIVDVGGQRTERKKWVHCFDNVKAVLFVVLVVGIVVVYLTDPFLIPLGESHWL